MCRILVIDDDAMVLRGLEMVVGGWGFQVVTATSTAEAVAMVMAYGAPDGIVADYRLRGDDNGMLAILAVAEIVGARPPSVIITGETAPSRLEELQKAGMPVMHKPVMPHRMWKMLESLLGGDCVEFQVRPFGR